MGKRKIEKRGLNLSAELQKAVDAARARYYGTINPDYITELSALENEAVFCAASTIAEMIACFPMVIMRRTDKGAEPVRDYPIQTLLNSPGRGDSNQTGMDFWGAFLLNMLIKGNGYAYQDRNRATAETRSLELLKPGEVNIYRGLSGIRYKHTPKSDPAVDYSAKEIFHVPALSYDGLSGLSPIELFRNNFVESLNVDNYVTNFFKKGVFSNYVFEFPEGQTDISKNKIAFIKRKFAQLFGGLENMGEPFITDPGTKIHEFKGATNKDADIVGLRKEAVLKVSRIYKLPPHMLNLLDNANYSNVVAMNSQFYKVTLLPWIKRIEAGVNTQLIPPYDQGTYFCKVNAKAILRGNDKERAEYYRTMKNLGILSVNEIRDLEDVPRLDTPAADYHMYPLNESPLEKFMNNIPDETGKEKDNDE